MSASIGGSSFGLDFSGTSPNFHITVGQMEGWRILLDFLLPFLPTSYRFPCLI